MKFNNIEERVLGVFFETCFVKNIERELKRVVLWKFKKMHKERNNRVSSLKLKNKNKNKKQKINNTLNKSTTRAKH